MKLLIQKKIQDPLAMQILDGEVKEGETITVDADDLGNVLFERAGEKKRAARAR